MRLIKKSKGEPLFPKIMIWEQYEMVAIFFNAKRGFVIDSGRTDTPEGSELTETSNFVNFDGEIILRNS